MKIKNFILFVIFTTSIFGCKSHDKNECNTLNTVISYRISSFKRLTCNVPLVIGTYFYFEGSDYNENISAFHEYKFICSNHDTAILKLENLIFGHDSFNNNEEKLYDHLKLLVKITNITTDSFRRENINLSECRLYVLHYNIGFLAVGCINNYPFSIQLYNVRDTICSDAIIRSIKIEDIK
jgi:hypothetical protein